MVITTSTDTFIHRMTINTLKSKKNVQLWQFSVSKGNINNYEKEKKKIEYGKEAIWTKPDAYPNYKGMLNILLVTDKKHTDVYEFHHSNNEYRDYWNINKNIGVINLNVIGKLQYGSSEMSTYCRYRRWSIGNRFQPIKRVTLNELLQNMEKPM